MTDDQLLYMLRHVALDLLPAVKLANDSTFVTMRHCDLRLLVETVAPKKEDS